MKIFTFLFLLLTTTGFNFIHAQYEVLPGETLTILSNTDWPMPDGIIVHNGGTIVIEQDGHIHVGAGKEIRVKDGGKIIGYGGKMTILGTGIWEGIVVESGVANSNLALDLRADVIEYADTGILMDFDTWDARRIRCNGTTFVNNKDQHIHFWGGGLNVPNGSQFIDCNFLNTTNAGWPLKFNFVNDIQFLDCVFDAHAGYQLHVDQANNLLVQGCEFYYNKTGIGLHFNISNITIRGSNFYCTSNNSDEAIDVGQEGGSNPLENISIVGNSFSPGGGGYGINAGGDHDPFYNFKISGNDFIDAGGPGFEACINISNASGSTCRINGNSITGAEYGILSTGNNSNLLILCNGFDNNNYHIYNEDILSHQLPTGADPNNKFFYTPNIDIHSENSQVIYYIYGGVQTSLTPNNNYNVSLISTINRQACKRDFDDGQPRISETDPIDKSLNPIQQESLPVASLNNSSLPGDPIIQLYPNPTKNHLSVSIDPSSTIAEVLILDSTGQLIQQHQLEDKGSNIFHSNISTIPQGVYWCKISLSTGESFTKSFVIQR